ncbi:MAG: hypothetical protein AMXMBFR47_03300 [Planctomycetota bacterium]
MHTRFFSALSLFIREIRCTVAIAAGFAAMTGYAQQPPGYSPESPNDPPGVPAREVGPPASPRGNLDPGFQVNVNAAGLNILGDAANEPSICVDPTRPNRMAIGWRQFDTVASNFRQAGYAWSRDAGRTWTFPGSLTPGLFRSDPVLRSTSSGVFYYYSLSTLTSCEFFRSLDGGRTWGPPLPGFGGDKQWFAIDTTGGASDGNIYGCWSQYYGCCGNNVFTRSVDDAASFSTPISLPQGHVFGTLDVGPDGEVYLVGGDAPTRSTQIVTRSSDAASGGAITFDRSTQVPLGVMVLGTQYVNPSGLLGQASVVVDRSNGPRRGWVYVLCSVDPPGSDPLDVRFARSTDGGLTFSTPVRINDDPAGTNAYQWFGTMSIAPSGRIDVVWNDTRHAANPSQPVTSELYYSFSNDGGVTWSANEQLAQSWNHLVGFPQQQKIGDYYDMWSDDVGANLAYAATYNGEQDVWFRRIGDYDCNGNGVGDGADVSSGTSNDVNGDGIPDECQCLGDLDASEEVDLADLAGLLATYGLCEGDPGFAAGGDLTGDGCVGLEDLAALLTEFGRECP